MRLDDHPGWKCVETAVIMVFALVFLYLNASHFDATEWETMKELLIVGLALRLIGRAKLKH